MLRISLLFSLMLALAGQSCVEPAEDPPDASVQRPSDGGPDVSFPPDAGTGNVDDAGPIDVIDAGVPVDPSEPDPSEPEPPEPEPSEPPDPPERPRGRIIFNGDFETGDLSQWRTVQRCRNDRILVYSAENAPPGAPPPRQGRYAARFRVHRSDVAPCTPTGTPRAQLGSQPLFRPGDEVWEAWALYVPDSYRSESRGLEWVLFQEDYGPPWSGPPAIAWNILFENGRRELAVSRGIAHGVDRVWRAPLPTDRWITFLVHKRFGYGRDGFIEAWVDGEPIGFAPCGGCTRLHTETLVSDQHTLEFLINHYRSAGIGEVTELFLDGARVGTTREIVELR